MINDVKMKGYDKKCFKVTCFFGFCIRIKDIEARNIFFVSRMIILRKASIKIWSKNILRIFQALFGEEYPGS